MLSAPARHAWLLIVLAVTPWATAAQVEITGGVTIVPEAGVGGRHVGPTLSVTASAASLGLPVFLEAGAGRTDFSSLGQDYHNNHYLLALGLHWTALEGATSVSLRLGVGAYAEFQTVETDPPQPGGDNWIETIVPGIVVTRRLESSARLVLAVSDALLGPYYAVLDPEEYDIDHRLRVLVGVQF